MMHSQEPRVSSSQDSLCLNNNSSVSALVKRLNSCTATPPASKGSTGTNEEEKKVLAILPWLPQFSMLSRFSLGSRNIKQLKKLMSLYLGHISEMVKKSLKKTVRAAKLKKNMSEVLVMFHMMYLDIREVRGSISQIQTFMKFTKDVYSFEQGSYLDTMSDLVAMYLDMEIRASKRMKETLPNVVSRLTMYLYILLGNSEIHILETILKARLFTKHHEKICAPIIGKVVGSAKPSSLQTMMYVRYLLVYKLWKRVAGSSVERIRINKLAMQKLVAPASLLDKSSAPIFISVLPKKPKTKKNTTMFFMQAKFDLKKSVQAFLKLLKESKISDFPAVMTKKSASLSSPSPFLDIESSLVCGDESISPFNDIWSSISSIDVNFSEQVQESPVIEVKKEKETDVTSTQKSPTVKKHKKMKGKIKVIANSSKEKRKRKKNKQKSVKTCTALSLNCIKPSVICKESKKKNDKLCRKENSLSVVDLASNLRALSTIDSSVTPDSVLASAGLSPREVHSLQYESLSSTTPMESLPAGIPTPPASLPPPVAEQIPPTRIRAPVSGITTSLEALLEGLPRKREQPDSDDGDRELEDVKCNLRDLGNVADSSHMEVGEVDSKLNILTTSSVNTASVAERVENSGHIMELSTNIKGDLDEGVKSPPSRGSSVICLGSEMDAEDNLASLCMDIALEEEHCMVEDTLVQPESTARHKVESVQDRTVGSVACVIQNVPDIVKVDSSGHVSDCELSPIHSLAVYPGTNISPVCGSTTYNSVISVVGVPETNSLSTEMARDSKIDTMFADSPLDEQPAVASNSIGDVAGTEDSLSGESVTFINDSDKIIVNGDIDVAEVVIPTVTPMTPDAVDCGSLSIVGLSDSGTEVQNGENSWKTSTTPSNVIVPCTSSNVAMLPSDNLPIVDDDQSSDEVQIISEHVTVRPRRPVKNESQARDDFTRLQKDLFNSAEYDSDVEILEGLAKDTREDLTLSHERATIARVEHRNELVVEQVLSGQFPVTLDLDNSQATLAGDLNFCGAPPDSPPINGGTLHFNEMSPINNKTGGLEFSLYEKTSDKIQPGSTDPWLTDSTNSFSFNFSRFSPVQETAPMDFLDDDADLSDDAYSAYSSHVPRFSEGGKRRSEEFRTKSHKEGLENLPDSRVECNGVQSSGATELNRTAPRPVSPVLQKESELNVPLCSRKPSSEKSSVRFPQVNTVRHFTSSLPCDQQEDKSDGDGDSVVEPPCKVTRTSKSSSPSEEADYFRQISSVQLEHLSEETVAAQQASAREMGPVTKALDEPKQQNKQAPKASPRGMCVDNDTIKLDVPIGNYTDMPPIPSFPSVPSAPLGFSYPPYVGCCCSLCYIAMLSGNRYQGHYLQHYQKPQETESENQALLKEIEKSLSNSVQVDVDLGSKDEQDFQYSAGKESSLPLKKRLKSIPPEPVSQVSANQSEVLSSSCENLPSYQSRRMISIAELELNKTVLKKWEDQVGMGKNVQYPQYNHNGYYSSYQMPGKDEYAANLQEDAMQEKRYPLELLHNEQDNYKKISSEAVYKDGLCYNPSMPANFQLNKDTNMNCVKLKMSVNNSDACKRPFKTPAELKLIPSMPDSLKELSAMSFKSGFFQGLANSEPCHTSVANRLTSVNHPVTNKECRQVLDLSVVKNVHCQKGGRKRKTNGTSVYNGNYSKRRCKANSVVQTTEMIDGFLVPYEKKRRKKDSSR